VLVRRKEIVDAQEESHATGELPPDQSHLLITRAWASKMPQPAPGGRTTTHLLVGRRRRRWRIIFHDTAEHVHENSIASSYSLTMTLTSSRPMGQTISSNRLIRWSVHYRGVMSSDWARPVVHWSIVALDPERQRSFYADLFNWEIGDGPIMAIPAGIGAGAGPEGHIQAGANPGYRSTCRWATYDRRSPRR